MKMLVLGAVLLASATLSARAAADAPPRLAVGFSGVLGATFGYREAGAVSDVVGAEKANAVAGLRLAPRWRALPRWSFGATGGVLFVPNTAQGTTRWWDAQAEVRFHTPGDDIRPDGFVWIGASAGLVVANDFIPLHVNDVGAVHPERTERNYGPAGSIAIGHDWALARPISLGLELRALFLGLDVKGMPTGGPTYHPQTAVLIGLTLTGRAL